MSESNQLVPIRNALISVFDKTGLDQLAPKLKEWKVRVFSTGGTASYLEDTLKLAVTRIEAVTDFPELMEGRVKTLHPRVFGGILARRDNTKDVEEATQHSIPLFDLVVVNLYPFAEHLNKEADAQSKFVDIGGPAMLRAGSKNHAAVTVLSDASHYPEFLSELQAHQGSTSLAFRKKMAVDTFSRTSAYDAMIASEWSTAKSFPTQINLTSVTALRYGENPHQKAAWCGQRAWEILQGKELSYNNLLDGEAATALVREFNKPAVSIIKHNNPCGVATANKTIPTSELFKQAFNADSQSAFGGIVACNFNVDAATAEAMSAIFLEVVIAEDFSSEARSLFSAKKNLRLIRWPNLRKRQSSAFEVRKAMDGWLMQESDWAGIPAKWETVTRTKVADEQQADLKFAWLVCKHVRSNAIVIAQNGVTLGIGAGQMSRVDSVTIALQKAKPKMTAGAVLASDAFFPFRDNIDKLAATGVSVIVQPGGSQRDAEVIEACDELGIAMIFTGERHFRH